ncbi:methyltransferase [Chitinivorax sp. B]|uniref:methyltransferase n=1 Tax=Chitinivorax sp. B TaxID=2502235 RepID=UPI0010F94715|nr:methyltransferase [Chitinivorax sp. B]
MAQDSSLPEFWETRYQTRATPWDAGQVPPTLLHWLAAQQPGRVLIPGCGSGHEVIAFIEAGWDVLAIDFSEGAIQQAQQTLGSYAKHVQFGDFFKFDIGLRFDLVYERAFLCALPRSLWVDYAHRQAALLRETGLLAGFFFLKDTPKGPPFGTSQTELDSLLSTQFKLIESRRAPESIPVFVDHEWWQVWAKQA